MQSRKTVLGAAVLRCCGALRLGGRGTPAGSTATPSNRNTKHRSTKHRNTKHQNTIRHPASTDGAGLVV
jgi:hypothetical protein